ncbi:ribosome maturation factor RimP [Dactylosporangium sp. NPDC049742]|uniref:ribosome maturation factor RimP n=1 Tax=Dactylosporangium sp. NPDC049742 TaxID=3154737 RepID=UPI0034495873
MAQQRDRRSGGSRDAGARDAGAHRERLRKVVEPVIVAAGFDLEELEVSRVGRRHLLRVAVDSDRGVDLDAVAEVSRAVSAALDEAEAGGDELIAGEYELEVGSRGVDRPLTEPRHWRRNRTRLVQVDAAGVPVTGRVTAVSDTGVTLDVEGAARTVAFEDLGPGRVQVEMKRLAELPEDEEDDFADDEDDDDDEEGEDEA